MRVFTRSGRIACGLVGALLLVGLLAMQSQSATAADMAIDIKGFAFTPQNLTIPVGTKITWTNRDTATHTATSLEGAVAPFESGKLSTGQSFTFTFTQPGVYPYYCSIHPNMKAMITVTGEGAGTTSPAPPAAPTAAPTVAPTLAPPTATPPPAFVLRRLGDG